MKKIFLLILLLIFAPMSANADKYVPQFDNMKLLNCEITETIYNQDNSIASKNNYHRLLRFDDESNLLYIQKDPVDKLLTYNNQQVRYAEQSMTDDFIVYSDITINRANNEYESQSRIVYDNPDFAPRFAKAHGLCKSLN